MFKKTNNFIIALILLSISLTACQSGVAGAAETAPLPVSKLERSQILVLGDISEDPADTIQAFQPLADYIAANLTDLGIQEGKVVVAKDLEGMIRFLKSGQVDLYFDSPYPALASYEQANAVPLLRRWKGGVGEYHTIIVAGKESGVTDLTDLVGKTLAFEDPASTSAYLLPKAYLVSEGYSVVEQSNTNNLGEDAINYVFATTEENILAWILEGKVAGGVIANGDYEDLSAEKQDQLIVLAQTQAVPRHIVLASPNLDNALRQRITELLLELDSIPEGQEILETFEETSQFDSLPEAENTLKSLQELFEPVR